MAHGARRAATRVLELARRRAARRRAAAFDESRRLDRRNGDAHTDGLGRRPPRPERRQLRPARGRRAHRARQREDIVSPQTRWRPDGASRGDRVVPRVARASNRWARRNTRDRPRPWRRRRRDRGRRGGGDACDGIGLCVVARHGHAGGTSARSREASGPRRRRRHADRTACRRTVRTARERLRAVERDALPARPRGLSRVRAPDRRARTDAGAGGGRRRPAGSHAEPASTRRRGSLATSVRRTLVVVVGIARPAGGARSRVGSPDVGPSAALRARSAGPRLRRSAGGVRARRGDGGSSPSVFAAPFFDARAPAGVGCGDAHRRRRCRGRSARTAARRPGHGVGVDRVATRHRRGEHRCRCAAPSRAIRASHLVSRRRNGARLFDVGSSHVVVPEVARGRDGDGARRAHLGRLGRRADAPSPRSRLRGARALRGRVGANPRGDASLDCALRQAGGALRVRTAALPSSAGAIAVSSCGISPTGPCVWPPASEPFER